MVTAAFDKNEEREGQGTMLALARGCCLLLLRNITQEDDGGSVLYMRFFTSPKILSFQDLPVTHI